MTGQREVEPNVATMPVRLRARCSRGNMFRREQGRQTAADFA
jgi:hypothetical protein